MTDNPRARDRLPPGWYADPNGHELLRWWDGMRWTSQTGPMYRATARQDATRAWTPGPDVRDGGQWDPFTAQDVSDRDEHGSVDIRPVASQQSAPQHPAPDEEETDNSRATLSFSVLFALSLVCLGAGYALDLSVVRILALTGALFFGVGTAPLQLSERASLDLRLAVAGIVGLSVPLIGASIMVLTPVWHPTLVAVVIGVISVAVHVIACRRVLLDRPRRQLRAPSRKLDSRFLDLSLAFSVLGTVLWIVAALTAGHMVPGVLGFLPKISIAWYLGLVLLIAGLVLSRGKRESRAVLPVVSLQSALTLTSALVYGAPRSQSAAKHIDLVQTILQAHYLNRHVGIYQAYSGYFSGIAWVSDVSKMNDLLGVATYWPFFIDLIALAGLRYFFGQLTSSRVRVWAATTLAVLANSIGADYFSPQAAGFALGLGVFGLAVADHPRGLSFRMRIALLVLAGSAMSVTHELSPYMVGGALTLLVLFRVIRPWYLPATILVPAGLWALINSGILSGFVYLNLGTFSNFAPPKTVATPGLQRLPVVGESSDALALGLLILILIAGIGLIRNLRNKSMWAFMACPGVGLVLIAANPYGNEGIFRAALFAIPWLAAAGIPALPRHAPRWADGAYAAVAVTLTATFLVSMYGLDNEQVIRPADYRALQLYQNTASPESYLLGLSYGNLPTSVEFPMAGHVVSWTTVLSKRQVQNLTPAKGDAVSLAKSYYAYVKKNGGTSSNELYAIWSPATADYAVDYGLGTLAQAEAWRNLMIASPDWQVIYASEGTYLFRARTKVLTRHPVRSAAKKKKKAKTATG